MALIDLRDLTNGAGVVFDPDDLEKLYAEDYDKVKAALKLGTKSIKTEGLQLANQTDNALLTSLGNGTLIYRSDVSRIYARLGGFDVVVATLVPQIHAVTIASTGDSNPAALTLIPTASVVHITNNDPDGANVTLSESGAVSGQELTLFNVSANPITIVHISGQVQLPEEQNRVVRQWDFVTADYVVDRWIITTPPSGAV